MRGNGKIIQELEAAFRGAGWNVHQGDLGRGLGPAARARHRRLARAADERGRRRRVPEVHGRGRRLHPRALLRQVPRAARRWSRTFRTSSCRSCAAAATIRRRSTPPTSAAVEHRGPADGDPGQDDQGLRPGRGGRGQERHPPAEEARPTTSCATSATASTSRSPTTELADGAVLPAGRRQRGDRVPARAPPRRWAASCPARACRPARWRRPSASSFAEFHGGGEREVSTTMAFVQILRQLLKRPGDRPADRADRPRRGAHLRHGVALPPVRHLLHARASSTSRSTPGRCCSTGRRRTARSSRRGSPRPARCARSPPPAPPTRRTAST